MHTTLEPVRPIQLSEIRAARERIAKTIVRTPLIRLELGPEFPDIRLKLENLQPINAYKLRGAANAVAALSEADHKHGVWTISAGNAGQGVAYAARAREQPLPKLPVARAIWHPHPNLKTAAAAWIYAGGAHHTCFSQALSMDHMEDFAEIAGIELVRIDSETRIHQLRRELVWSDAAYKLQ